MKNRRRPHTLIVGDTRGTGRRVVRQFLSEGGDCWPEIDIPKGGWLCEGGKLDCRGLVSKRHRLEQIDEAINGLNRGPIPGHCMVWIQNS